MKRNWWFLFRLLFLNKNLLVCLHLPYVLFFVLFFHITFPLLWKRKRSCWMGQTTKLVDSFPWWSRYRLHFITYIKYTYITASCIYFGALGARWWCNRNKHVILSQFRTEKCNLEFFWSSVDSNELGNKRDDDTDYKIQWIANAASKASNAPQK